MKKKKSNTIRSYYFRESDCYNSKLKRMHDIMYDNLYFEWLDKFTFSHDGFLCIDWMFSFTPLSELDCKRMCDIELLFLFVERYAKKNYIKASVFSCGRFYNVKIASIIYEIGVYNCEGGVYYCNRLNNDVNNFILYEDILSDKKSDYVINLEENLNNFSNAINTVYEDGTPIELIVSSFNDTIGKIKDKNNLNYKSRLKKN